MKSIRLAFTILALAPALTLNSCKSPVGEKQLPYGRSLGGGIVESPYKPYNTIDTKGVAHGAIVEDPVTKEKFIKP